MKTLTADEVRALLRAECEKAGGVRAWGRRYGVSAGMVSRIIRGERPITECVAAPLGLSKVVNWKVDAIDNERKRA